MEQAGYLLILAGAVVFAAGFKGEQTRPAVFVACALFSNWVFCGWTYEKGSPQDILEAMTGFRYASYLWWQAADFLVTAAAITMGRKWWWGWAMLWLGELQLCFHAAHEKAIITDTYYTWWLDKLLLAQVSVFLLGGWKGVRDAVSSAVDTLPSLRGLGSRVSILQAQALKRRG